MLQLLEVLRVRHGGLAWVVEAVRTVCGSVIVVAILYNGGVFVVVVLMGVSPNAIIRAVSIGGSRLELHAVIGAFYSSRFMGGSSRVLFLLQP